MSTVGCTRSVVSRLIVMRHAKSDYPSGVGDHDRPLAPRGVRDAGAASRWLRDRAESFTSGSAVAIVSSATRTQQTWDIAGQHLHDVRRVNEPAVYEASVSTIINLAIGEGSETTYIVGHNPTMHQLVLNLMGEADDQVRAAVTDRFRTCAIAVFALNAEHPWDNGSAKLITAVVPRG